MTYKKRLNFVIILGLFIFSSLNAIQVVNFNEKPSEMKLNTNKPGSAAMNRNNTYWSTGYWLAAINFVDSFLPWSGNTAYGISFMYESLFGWNEATQEFIPCIGKEIYWSPDGYSLTIILNEKARWTGPGVNGGMLIEPGVNDNITAYDVQYSLDYLQNSKWGDYFMNVINSINVLNNTALEINMITPFNQAIIEMFTTNFPILSRIVWQDISNIRAGDSYLRPDPSNFKNQWWDAGDVLPQWKVCSGPYYPTNDINSTHEIYMKNTDWWGNGTLYRDILGSSAIAGPKPEMAYPDYIGLRHFSDTANSSNALLNNEIDQSMLFNASVDFSDISPNLHGYYADDHYRTHLPISGYFELVFNTYQYPLSEPWFRKAIATALDYESYPKLMANDSKIHGSPTYLNLENPDHAVYFSQKIHDQYCFETDPYKAKDILYSHGCYQKDGQWFATLPPEEEIPLVANYGSYEDQDPTVDGINIQLGTFYLKSITGWTDVELAVNSWVSSLHSNLELEIEVDPINFGLWIDDIQNMNYSMAVWVSGPGTYHSAYAMFKSLAQPHNTWNNPSDWRGPNRDNFMMYFTDFERASTVNDKLYFAEKMQEMYAQDLPTIPIYPNMGYYWYNDLYWKGAVNQAYNHTSLLMNAYVDHFIELQRNILGLVPKNETWNPPTSYEIIIDEPEKNRTRENTYWTTGYWYVGAFFDDAYLPWAGTPTFGSNFMYDTLFGFDELTNTYIPCIGETINWINGGQTVEITLNPNAKWAGPGLTAPDSVVSNINITAMDVQFSYYYMEGSPKYWIQNMFSSINIIDNTTLEFELYPEYANSQHAKEIFTKDFPIINREVWQDISLQKTGDPNQRVDPSEYQNRWYDRWDTMEKWKVLSGPYFPIIASPDKEIYQKNHDWWGQGILYRDILGASAIGGPKPEMNFPEYIGIKPNGFSSYFYDGMEANNFDQMALTLYNFSAIQEINSDLHGWYADEDVRNALSQGSTLEIGFNTYQYPLSEPWFRKAIAFSINYDPISTLVSNNEWDRASPTYLNPQNPDHLTYYSQAIHDQYKFDEDPLYAISLLENNGCYEKNGQWYATVPITPGLWDPALLGPDADSEIGHQVAIGPYTILTPTGWNDVNTAVDMWADSIRNNLGIIVSKEEQYYSEPIQTSLNNNDFDMAMWIFGPSMQGNAFQTFKRMISPHSTYGNISSWRGTNAESFISIFSQFETETDEGSRISLAHQLQEYYAMDLPTIPTHRLCLWYQYSDAYWKGYQNQAYEYGQPCTNFILDQTVLKQKQILALVPADDPSWNPPSVYPDIWTNWPVGREPVSIKNPGIFNISADFLGNPDVDGFARFQWTPSAGAENYSIIYSTDGIVSRFDDFDVLSVVTGTSFDLTNFADGHYYFRVIAQNTTGSTISTNSIEATIAYDPSLFLPGAFDITVKHLTMPDVDGYIRLEWMPSAGADNYTVVFANVPISDISDFYIAYLTTEDLFCDIANMDNGVYYFMVIANNETGSILSNNVIYGQIAVPETTTETTSETETSTTTKSSWFNAFSTIPWSGFEVSLLIGIIASIAFVLKRKKQR